MNDLVSDTSSVLYIAGSVIILSGYYLKISYCIFQVKDDTTENKVDMVDRQKLSSVKRYYEWLYNIMCHK